MSEIEKIPRLRFPQFTDTWEQRKLSDVTDEFQSGKFIAAADIEETGEYPVYGGNGLRGYCNTYNHDGDFALIGRQGALCGNMNYSCGKAYFTEHAVAVKANSSSNTRFLYYLLDKMNLGQYSDQSAQPGLAVGKLIKLVNMFPSKEEQDKVGDFLEDLDNLITLHQCKLEQAKSFKQGILQKMFPREGEVVPELRFPGFKDVWEKRKLGDILTERHVLSKISNDYPRLSFTIEEGVINPEARKTNKRDFLMKDEANKKFLLTEIGDIIYNPANVVFGAIHRNSYGKGCLSPIYKVFETSQDSRFLECVVRSKTFISKMAQKTEGTVVKLKTLKPDAFLEMSVFVASSLDEQTKIANFIEQLDTFISLHQGKLEQMIQYKAGLLQQMLV